MTGRRNGYGDFDFDEGKMHIDENGMVMRAPLEIRVIPSRDDRFHVTQIIKSQGSNNLAAQENAARIEFTPRLSGDILQVPLSYRVPKGEKWRGQHVRINIEVPSGKSIRFDENIHRCAGADLDEYDDKNNKNYISIKAHNFFINKLSHLK